jgi:predicted ATPase
MLISARYEAEQKVHESSHHVIYRGRRQADGAPVILKLLNQAYPTAEQLQRFRWEHEVLERLALPGVVRSYGLEESAGSAVIVLEDFGGVPLAQATGGAPLPLPELLSVAARLTTTLGEIHRRGVIHRDLNPTNILWNRATDTLKIIDFGLAAVLPRESPALPRPLHLEGTVAYVAPEQTGRLSRGVDQRTDLYALGVTLFELLTGRRPFLATDPSELVHQHLARTPPAPDTLVPGLPAPVSQIVLKLLAKRPEDRYQGTCGLAADLERCRASLGRTGAVADFPLGEQDVADTFRLPDRIHGREAELQALEVALHRAHGGGRELVLVSGPGGIGKSALVEALRHRHGLPEGTFLAGKHDQVRRGVPYAGLAHAFQGLVSQILGEPAEAVAAWRQRLLQSLGNGAPLIVEILPAVGLILGPQPGIAAISLDEARNRFSYVLTRFVALFATADRPLVLFLDDLQWADGPTLKVIELLVTDPAVRHVLVIGALRDGEVDATHPAALMLARVRQAGAPVTEVHLGPLGAPAIEQLLADGLRCDPASVPALAERCRTKTAGNPFFLGQFLRTLYEVGALNVDPARGWWRCDLAAVDRAEATDNVLVLLMARLRRLAPETQVVIRLAACLGGRFTARSLARAGEQPEAEAGAAVAVAVAEGLFVPEADPDDAASEDGDGGDASDLAHRFVHERVQQAAYALIPEAERPALRWRIGQALLAHATEAELEANLFEVVSHLDEGRDLARTDAERERLCRLNLRAGQKARAAAAFTSALRFLGVAHALLPPDAWASDPDLALALHAEAAAAAYLVGDFDRMEGYLAAAEPHLGSALEVARFAEIRICALSQGNPMAAVKAGIPVLRQLGYDLPERPSQARLVLSLLRTRLAYRARDIERLVDLPPLEDPRLLTALRILQSITAASYMQSTWEFKAVNVLDRVNAVIRHGLHPNAAFDFASYGTILCAMGNVDAGHRFGELALRLLDRPGTSACRAKALMTFNRFIGHWKRHVGETLDGFLDAYRSGCESGDIEYAGYAILAYYTHSFFLGKELGPLEGDVGAFLAAHAGSRQATIHRPLRLYRQAMRHLVEPVEAPWHLVGEGCDEDALLADFRSTDYHMGTCILYLLKLMLAYLFRQHRQAALYAGIAVGYAEFVKGQIYLPILELYDSLARLAIYRESAPADRREIRARVRRNQKRLAGWARHAPMNYRHKHALVAAEEARVTDRPGLARELYDRAISEARQHGYRNEEALAQELAGNFYLELGHEHLAFHYLRDAKAAYRQWGARAKVQALERHFPQVLTLERTRPGGTVTRTASTRSTSEGPFTELDLSTVFKAAQALSSQLELDRLLPALMELLIESAGPGSSSAPPTWRCSSGSRRPGSPWSPG